MMMIILQSLLEQFKDIDSCMCVNTDVRILEGGVRVP